MRREYNLPIDDTMSISYDPATVHFVFEKGTREEVFKMLQNKINWNDIDDNGHTALHAILRNFRLIETDVIEVLTHLLTQGIAPVIENNHGQTVSDLAAERKMRNAVNILLNFVPNDRGISKRAQKSREERLVLAAIEAKNVTFLKFLADSGADFNFRSHHGQTPLHLLVEIENYERSSSVFYNNFCDLLVRGGCEVNATDHRGESALHKAATYGNVLMARKLIDLGADINCKDKEMRTPLHEAAKTCESVKVAELLIKNGAKVNAKDCADDRPLHLVFEKSTLEQESILKILLKEGAYVDARNLNGESALYCAVKLKNRVLIDELLKYGANVIDSKVVEMVRNNIYCRSLLSEHRIKLSTANLDAARLISDYEEERDRMNRCECLREIEKLKSTFIDDHDSLYEFLHMRLKRRFAYVNQKTLKHLVESPSLNEQFPKYSIVILGCYREALIRKSLSEQAEEVLVELTQVHLPDVIEKIFVHLTNEDLINIIDSTYQ